MKITRFTAIIYIFFLISLNCLGQESNKFIVVYEDFKKIKEIEELIKNSDVKVFEKYGVSLAQINSVENSNFQEFFIGYQAKSFDGVKYLELMFDRKKIEDFFIKYKISFSISKKNMKTFISILPQNLAAGDSKIIENSLFQNQLESLKLITQLNQNINLEYEYLDVDQFKEKSEIPLLTKDLDYVLMSVQQTSENKWIFKFPLSNRVFTNNTVKFYDYLLDEIISTSTKSREILRNNFTLEIQSKDFEMVENLLNFLASRNEVLTFSLKNINSDYIKLEYETYLDELEAEIMLSEFRWQR